MTRWLIIIIFSLTISACKLNRTINTNSPSQPNDPSSPGLPTLVIHTENNGNGSQVTTISTSVNISEDFFISFEGENLQEPQSITWSVISGPAIITPSSDKKSIDIIASFSGSGQIELNVDGESYIINYEITPFVQTCAGGPTVFSTNMNARTVIGQADFIGSSANRGGAVGADTLNNPLGVWVKDGKLFISDGNNNRILVYNSIPTTNGAPADEVIGQPSFTSSSGATSSSQLNGAQGIAIDDTHLMVSEWANNRISLWPLADLSSIEYVLGQLDFVSGSSNQSGSAGSSTINHSTSSAFNSNYYFVTDASNHRVLVYNKSLLTSGMNASIVLGQPDFTTTTSGSTSSKLNFPLGVHTDGTSLVIGDSNNNRVLLYNNINSLTSGMAADVVISTGFGTGLNQMSQPVGALVDGTRLFVADRGNDRILIYNSLPSIGNENADIIIGQNGAGSGDHNQCNCSTAAANTLWGVHFMYWDGCRLFVSDKSNNRVLIY